ncbi:LysR family transcriptional regulator, partial [Burkholderia cenocepacia]|nr:LysR family transcriptional regulator [Burkholderia cenocepacia]
MEGFDSLESSVGTRQQSPQGLVKLTTAPAYGRLCVTPLLPGFFRQYPHVALELSVSERQVDLVGEGLDLAIRHGPLMDSSLTARKLSETESLLVASPGYLAAKGKPTR